MTGKRANVYEAARGILWAVVAMLLTQSPSLGSPAPLAVDKADDIRARLSTYVEKMPPVQPSRKTQLAQWWGNFPNWPNWGNWSGWMRHARHAWLWPRQ